MKGVKNQMNSEEIAAAMMILQKLFVTLEEFAGFLYIKAMQGIEIYSLITPSLLPHEGIGKKVTTRFT
jgi:hypothetical protein